MDMYVVLFFYSNNISYFEFITNYINNIIIFQYQYIYFKCYTREYINVLLLPGNPVY